MTRVVLDTNVLVASTYNAASASRQIVDACRDGKLTLVTSPAIRQEYERVLPRAIRKRGALQPTFKLIESAEVVVPASTPCVVKDDPEDDKFIAAAVAGRADVLITNDRRVLEVEQYEGVRVMSASAFAEFCS